ncbi:uncharacterized protein LOC117110145 [Anneissia japonica]|uniref:uncharacterized protein LOC117110145 n=1 Tax=Anneissia japonica TaxID=1529436 RepID=UPI0014256233|nr:uncharacterized protein LOC117110145 [Anneissia japonica]
MHSKMHFQKEANKIIGQGSRKKAKNVITNVCTFENLRSYEFSPPNMKKVCDYWTSDYKEELLAVLSKDIDAEEQELELCFEVTDACVGVDRSNFRINKYKGPKARKVPANKEKKKEKENEEDNTEKKKKKKTSDKKTKTDRATKANGNKDEL